MFEANIPSFGWYKYCHYGCYGNEAYNSLKLTLPRYVQYLFVLFVCYGNKFKVDRDALVLALPSI